MKKLKPEKSSQRSRKEAFPMSVNGKRGPQGVTWQRDLMIVRERVIYRADSMSTSLAESRSFGI